VEDWRTAEGGRRAERERARKTPRGQRVVSAGAGAVDILFEAGVFFFFDISFLKMSEAAIQNNCVKFGFLSFWCGEVLKR